MQMNFCLNAVVKVVFYNLTLKSFSTTSFLTILPVFDQMNALIKEVLLWSRGRTISLVRFLMLLNYIIIILKSKIKDGPARFSAAVFALFSRGVKWHSFVEKYRFVLTRATRQVPHVEQDLLNHLRSPRFLAGFLLLSIWFSMVGVVYGCLYFYRF